MFSLLNEALSSRRLNLLFFWLICTLIIAISFGYRDFSRYRNKVIASNGQFVQGLARIIAIRLRSDMNTYREMFASFQGGRHRASEGGLLAPDLCNMLGDTAVADAWVVDDNGILLFSCSGIPPEGKDLSKHPAFLKARNFALYELSSAGMSIEKKSTTCFFGLTLGDKVMLFPVSLSTLVQRILIESGIADVANAWIIGPGGTFLFHSLHPEMVGQDILIDGDECKGCHQNFLNEQRMGKEIKGTEQFKVSGLAFVRGFWTEQMLGEEWTLVVSAPLVDVPASRRVEAWWLIPTMLVILVLATVMIYGMVTRIRDS